MLSACSVTGKPFFEAEKVVIPDKTLTASGFGQLDQNASISIQHRRFAAEQSAKIKGYRQLASQLYQEKLPGGLTVAGQVMKNETYRMYFDTFLREAQVVDWQTSGTILHANMELTVTDRFYQCIASELAFLKQCLREDNKMPFTRLGYKKSEAKGVNLACGSDCGGQLSMNGFSQGKKGFDQTLLNYGLYDKQWILNMSSNLLVNFILLKSTFQ